MNALTKYWFLEGFDLLRKLGKPSMMQMCEMLEMEHIDKGKTIEFRKKDKKSIYFLKKGTVKITDMVSNTAKFIVKKGIPLVNSHCTTKRRQPSRKLKHWKIVLSVT